MNIERIFADSPHFEEVVALGKRNSKWLGHFPRGAFVDAAVGGYILGALNERGSLDGYLLYRISREYAVIVHLCVAQSARGKGTARALFDTLKRYTSECRGVKLRCRGDFPADTLWPRLGFNPVNQQPGRSMTGKLLTIWLFEYDQPTLFTATERTFGEHQALAVLDANVVYDLQDPLSEATEESQALSADWLNGELEFCITEELNHEIYRSRSEKERARRWRFLEHFHKLTADSTDEARVSSILRPLFPAEMSDNDRSDLRHLVITIVAGAPFFVTRDEGLLEMAGQVHDQFGVSILRPCELVVGLDQKIRASEYVPARMAGSLTEVQRVTTPEIVQLTQTFQDFSRRELKAAFQQRLRTLLGDPHACDTYIVRDETDRPVGLYTVDRSASDRIRIPLLRVLRGRLAQGLTHHILWKGECA